MKQIKFLGIDLTPRKEYRKVIAELTSNLYVEREKVKRLERERDAIADERTRWKQKYYDLRNDTPARGKGGKFVKRNKES